MSNVSANDSNDSSDSATGSEAMPPPSAASLVGTGGGRSAGGSGAGPGGAAGAGSPDGKVWTVSEITRLVKELIEQSLYPVWLVGEVSNLTIHRSGHVYFTLKDANCQISAVYFKGADAARGMRLEAGMAVEAFGKLSVFEPRGNYQVLVRYLRPKGLGALQMQFEMLKQKLQAEGLFDTARKRPIPKLPTCVGVVTSPEGAALRDFLSVIRRRFGDMHVRIYPAAVQGAAAAEQVAEGIRVLNETRACDVIVVTRGGGSLEDLWAFNEEIVARAVAASTIPVISAVGHEVDFTICDFTADLRVPTPSAAAELVVGSQSEYLDRVANLQRRMQSTMQLELGEARRRLQRAASHYALREPLNLVRMYQQRVDEATLRLEHGLSRRVTRTADRLARAATRLNLLNPRRVLGRGYAILLDARDGKPVTRADAVTRGDRLRAVLSVGDLAVEVQDAVWPGSEAPETPDSPETPITPAVPESAELAERE